MTDDKEATSPRGMNKEEIALELTRFIAQTTGFGKTGTGAGFSGKAPAPLSRSRPTKLNLVAPGFAVGRGKY